MADVLCIVCGQGSSRGDWQDGRPHACDSHSEAEVKTAIAALAPKTVAQAGTTGKTPPPAPPAPAEKPV